MKNTVPLQRFRSRKFAQEAMIKAVDRWGLGSLLDMRRGLQDAVSFGVSDQGVRLACKEELE